MSSVADPMVTRIKQSPSGKTSIARSTAETEPENSRVSLKTFSSRQLVSGTLGCGQRDRRDRANRRRRPTMQQSGPESQLVEPSNPGRD